MFGRQRPKISRMGDFFNLKDSSSWDDSTDGKLLHSNLFHAPISPKKSKKGKKQLRHKDAKTKPGRLVVHGQIEDVSTKVSKGDTTSFGVAEDQVDPPPKPGKKKRSRRNSQGSVGSIDNVRTNKSLIGKLKRTRTNSQGSVSSIDNFGLTGKQVLGQHKRVRTTSQGSVTSIDNFGSNRSPQRIRTNSQGSVGSIDDLAQHNVQQLYHKHVDGIAGNDIQEPGRIKKKKRKAKKNKFKDAEGHLKQQYQKPDAVDNAESKTSTEEQIRIPNTPNKTESTPRNTGKDVPLRSDLTNPKSSSDTVSKEKKKQKIHEESTNVLLSSEQLSNKQKISKKKQKIRNELNDEDMMKQLSKKKKIKHSNSEPNIQAAEDAVKKQRKRTPKNKKGKMQQNSQTTIKELPSQNAKLGRKAARRGRIRQEPIEHDRSLTEVIGSDRLLQRVTLTKKINGATTGAKSSDVETSHTKEKDAAGATRTHDGSKPATRSRRSKKAKMPLDQNSAALPDKDKLSLADDTKKSKGPGSMRKLSLADDTKKSKGPGSMRSRLESQLKGSHFRFINEKFYLCTGDEAFEMMKQDGDAFKVYHEGYSQQVQQWPVNPVDVIINYLQSKPASLVVGDFGCGEAKIAQTVKQKVHSFDLSALNKHVTVCDMTEVPLADNCLDVAVYCLSLMGTNWISYLKEANRLLKPEGILKIAEVASRFQSLAGFLKIMKSLGFHSTSKNLDNKMFYMFDFTKKKAARLIEESKGEVLKPCLYKKR